MTVAKQESTMSDDAVAYLAEAREIHKQPLFEDGRDWIVEIGRIRKFPQLLDDLRRVGRGTKEVRNQSKATGHFALERGGIDASTRFRIVREIVNFSGGNATLARL
jgi:hypothetical protein